MFPSRLTSILIFSGWLVAGFAPSVHAQQALPVTVSDALTRGVIPLQSAGIYVQDVGSDRPVLAVNAQAGFNPASTMKLVTSGAALELLGPAYSWKTRVYARGALRGDVLDGDLIIRGGGDPKLISEKFWQLLRQIRMSGIREIRGNVILDRSVFAATPYDTGAFDNAPLKPYNVGPDGLLLNYNVLTLRLRPDTANGTADVQFDPPLALAPNQVQKPVLSNGACGDWQGTLQPVFDGNGLRFAGRYPTSCGEKTWYIHPQGWTETEYVSLVFRQLWHEMGGLLQGSIVAGTAPTDARPVLEWESPSLPEIVRDVNKFSNNVMARHLLLAIAVQGGETQATPTFGANLVRAWLARKRIPVDKLVIENGSGLSRIEQITPETMGRMLVALYQSPIMSEFMSSMPVVGLDGTMRRRLVDDAVAGRAHIKTGSLDAVRSVAGYVQAASGRRYAVVFIINDNHAGAGRAAQDALLQWVYEKG